MEESSVQEVKGKALGWLQVGALLMFLSIALGAFGAHGLERVLTMQQLDVWHKGVIYLTTHALGLLLVSVLMWLLPAQMKSWCGVAWSFLLGVILFSGSLFLWALTQAYWLVYLTPIGGTLFLVGWLWLFWGVRKRANISS